LAFENTILALLFVWLIDRAARGFGGLQGRILEFPPFLYLGRISYGLYVIHLSVPSIIRWLFTRLGIPSPPEGAPLFWLSVAVTFTVAAASWHGYETPLTDLKERFSA
jgi:peptidoglycan/LPS O-acetylase OafA/YrhL